jgi:hypothetical protein
VSHTITAHPLPRPRVARPLSMARFCLLVAIAVVATSKQISKSRLLFLAFFFGCSAGVRHCYHEPIHVRERNNGIADESVMRDPPRIIMRVKPPARLSRVMPRLAVSVGFALLRAAPSA